MPEIDLQQDAQIFRSFLEARLKQIAAQAKDGGPVSAIEVGYDCGQGGWTFVHADRRSEHERDGEWTNAIDDDNIDAFPHWVDAMEANYEGEDVVVHRVDGRTFTIAGYDEDAEYDFDSEDDDSDTLADAIGCMILEVLMQAKADGVFASLSPGGTLQLDIEDFNGGWGWPEYDDLGRTNLV